MKRKIIIIEIFSMHNHSYMRGWLGSVRVRLLLLLLFLYSVVQKRIYFISFSMQMMMANACCRQFCVYACVYLHFHRVLLQSYFYY